jgi:hypothetical protein
VEKRKGKEYVLCWEQVARRGEDRGRPIWRRTVEMKGKGLFYCSSSLVYLAEFGRYAAVAFHDFKRGNRAKNGFGAWDTSSLIFLKFEI